MEHDMEVRIMLCFLEIKVSENEGSSKGPCTLDYNLLGYVGVTAVCGNSHITLKVKPAEHGRIPMTNEQMNFWKGSPEILRIFE